MTAFVIINLSQSIKLQFGLGQRYSMIDNADLADMGLSRSDVDSIYYSFRMDVGRF